MTKPKDSSIATGPMTNTSSGVMAPINTSGPSGNSAPSPGSENSPTAQLEGYLKMKKGVFGTWVRYYFRLIDKQVYFYKNSEVGAKMKGQFTIEHANITPVEHMTGKSNSFGIFKHKVPPVYLLSNTTDEMHTWIKALESISNPESVQSSGILDSIDGMVDPTVVANSRSKICGWNGAAEKMFGYTKSEAIGQDLSILMPPPYCDVHHNFVMNYKKTGQKKLIGLSRKLPAKRKDGTIISIELSLGEVPIAKGAILTEEQKQLAPRWVAVIREMNTTQASNAASVNSEEDSDGSSGSDDDAGDRSNLPEISQVKNTIVIPGISSSSSNNNNHVAVDANKSPSASLNKSPSTFSMNSAGDAKSPAVPSKDELSNQIEILRSENIRLMETLALIQKEKELLEIELKEYKNDEDSNLEKLLKDEFGYNAFLAYCMGERTEQNVMFWRFAEDYKHTLYVQDLKDKAEFIYETYIKEGAPYPLTMDSVRREFIKRAVQEPTRDTFASLQRHILSNMAQDAFVRFATTEKGRIFIDKFFARQKMQATHAKHMTQKASTESTTPSANAGAPIMGSPAQQQAK